MANLIALLIFAGFILLVVAVAAVLMSGVLKVEVPTGQARQYRTAPKALLKAAEQHFYAAIAPLIPAGCLLFAKVRLADVLDTSDQTVFRSSTQKHIDFVLCRAADFMPLLAIELDDRSHRQAARRKADMVKDELLTIAGIPIMRHPVQRTYNNAQLAQAMRETMS